MKMSGFRYRGNIEVFMFSMAQDEQAWAEEVAAKVRQNAPRRTGEYANSIEATPVRRDKEAIRVEVRALAPHAAALERGTGIHSIDRGSPKQPYLIVPTQGTLLAFTATRQAWPGYKGRTGSKRAYPFVVFPGIKAQRIMWNAFREFHATRVWSQAIRNNLRELLRARY